MFHGSIVALVTPMLVSGEVDYKALHRLIDWHIENKTDGFVFLGTTGESVTIEDNEKEQLIKDVVKYVNQRVPVIIGTGTNSTKKTIKLTEMAMEQGADAALLVTPYYNKPTQEGLYQHFKAIANAVPIPQILYNVPSRTGCDLLPETIGKLANISNIVALKDATGKLERLQQNLAANSEINYLSGDDDTALEFVLSGGKGVISVTANVAPKLMHDMIAAALNNDRKNAEKFNKRLIALHKKLFVEANPIPVKWALNKMGLIDTGIRLPLTPLSERFHNEVTHALEALEQVEN